MTADLTILIPTAGRPQMLRTALNSIRAQTARERIWQVVVSENLADLRSRAVCTEFPELPIRHVLRDPPLNTLDHAYMLFTAECETTFVAILHDDDWWRPGHLARSLAALEASPGATACYGNYWCVIGEHSSVVGQQDASLLWAAAGRPAVDNATWTLNHQQAILAMLGGALGHYSTLIARTTALRACARIYQRGNPMDNDRQLAAELSRHGDLLYHPLPEIFVRQHFFQDIRRFDDATQQKWLSDTTGRILTLAREDGIRLREALEELFSGHPEALRPYLLENFTRPWCYDTLAAEGLVPDLLKAHHQSRKLKLAWREWIPPALAALVRRWSNRR